MRCGDNVTVTVKPQDLKEFALFVLDEAKKQAETTPKEDVEMFSAEAAKYAGVSTNTLWRWAKTGYLKPHAYIGRKPLYLKSQFEKLKGVEA